MPASPANRLSVANASSPEIQNDDVNLRLLFGGDELALHGEPRNRGQAALRLTCRPCL